MITYKPIKLSLWLFVGGVSFGVALGWGWLILLGLLLPIGVLGGFLVFSLLQK
jgi:hypothetical protein